VSSGVCLDFVIRLFYRNFFTLSAFAFGSHIPVPSVQHTRKIVVCVIATRYFVSPSVRFLDCSDKCLFFSGATGTEV
jgi:hypothetical protein